MIKNLINEIELILFSPSAASQKYFNSTDIEALKQLGQLRNELKSNLDRILSENEIFEMSFRNSKNRKGNK
ncbi:hypothetical protein K6R49_003730 [Escherichia coli]|uniref:hypothetical protein n=1 Tax=Buttiauxella noackiae TaxID=82992 RepID=UPI001A002FDF|nr:hypothetical protein [Escherichia coli]MBJ0329698.1 hypothetical protein [Escherichia coli]